MNAPNIGQSLQWLIDREYSCSVSHCRSEEKAHLSSILFFVRNWEEEIVSRLNLPLVGWSQRESVFYSLLDSNNTYHLMMFGHGWLLRTLQFSLSLVRFIRFVDSFSSSPFFDLHGDKNKPNFIPIQRTDNEHTMPPKRDSENGIEQLDGQHSIEEEELTDEELKEMPFVPRLKYRLGKLVNSLRLFIYNKEHQTILGTTSTSWLKIAIYYFFFYVCLAFFYCGMVAVFGAIISRQSPRYTFHNSEMNDQGNCYIGEGNRATVRRDWK